MYATFFFVKSLSSFQDEIYNSGGKDRQGRREPTILAMHVLTGFERSLVEMFFNCDAFGSVMLSGQIPITKTMLYGMAMSDGTCNGQSRASAGIFYPESQQYVCEMLQHQTRIKLS